MLQKSSFVYVTLPFRTASTLYPLCWISATIKYKNFSLPVYKCLLHTVPLTSQNSYHAFSHWYWLYKILLVTLLLLNNNIVCALGDKETNKLQLACHYLLNYSVMSTYTHVRMHIKGTSRFIMWLKYHIPDIFSIMLSLHLHF